MIYTINSFEFQETDVFLSLNTNNKPKKRKLEKIIALFQTVSEKLSQWLPFVWRSLFTPLYISASKVKSLNSY